MPIVIIEQDGIQRGCVLERRTLIGRWPSNAIVIDDASVSRVHAWISEDDDGCFLTDAQSRTGTKVNGKVVRLRQRLRIGDEISIGPCRLIYQSGSGLPADIEPIHRPGSSDTGFPGTGILFDCHCGAPLWAPVKMVGQARRCHYCRAVIVIPPRGGMTAQSPVGGVTCSICQWRIDNEHPTSTCPECGLIFHYECWMENKGCSTYGCSQVNAQAGDDDGSAAEFAFEDSQASTHASWDNVLLTLSIAASIVGVLAFGVPALIVATASMMRWKMVKGKRIMEAHLPFAISICVSLIGIVAGVLASYWWWL